MAAITASDDPACQFISTGTQAPTVAEQCECYTSLPLGAIPTCGEWPKTLAAFDSVPHGCTDSAADNYDEGAALDSGGCNYTCSTLTARLGAPAGTRCLVYDDKWPASSLGNTSTRTIAAGVSWVVQGRPAKGARRIGRRAANVSLPVWLPALGFRLQVGESGGARARLVVRYVNASHLATPPRSGGGAIKAVTADVRVEASLFKGNNAGGYGGAIEARSASVRVHSSWFEGNVAGSGGAIWADFSGAPCPVTLEGSWFKGNSADSDGSGRGGAIYAGGVVRNGGGATPASSMSATSSNAVHSMLTVEGSGFEGNVAASNGGAIDVSASSIGDPFRVVLAGCTGHNNTDTGGKALTFSNGNGLTTRSLTDEELRLPVGVGGGGSDTWEYISYTHPESRPCALRPRPPSAVAGQCPADMNVSEGKGCDLGCAPGFVLRGVPSAKCDKGLVAWRASCRQL